MTHKTMNLTNKIVNIGILLIIAFAVLKACAPVDQEKDILETQMYLSCMKGMQGRNTSADAMLDEAFKSSSAKERKKYKKLVKGNPRIAKMQCKCVSQNTVQKFSYEDAQIVAKFYAKMNSIYDKEFAREVNARYGAGTAADALAELSNEMTKKLKEEVMEACHG